MTMMELQEILGYLNIGLAMAHNTGVSIGHFGNTDFIQFAEKVNSLLLHAIEPAAKGVVAGSDGVLVSTVEHHAPVVASVSIVS